MTKILLAALLLFAASPAAACKMASTYRPPTNFEMVEEAELIVLARVGDFTKGATVRDNRIALKPVRMLKGKLPPEPLAVLGQYELDQPEPTPLNRPNSSTLWGACARTAYAKGALVVAMFWRSPEGVLWEMRHPFARNVEDVESEQGVWVRAAALYVKLLEVPVAGRRAALEAEAARLDQSREKGDAEIANDLHIYLAVTASEQAVSPAPS